MPDKKSLTLRCPKCGSRDILHVQRVYEYHRVTKASPNDNGGIGCMELDLKDSYIDEEFDTHYYCDSCSYGPIRAADVVAKGISD